MKLHLFGLIALILGVTAISAQGVNEYEDFLKSGVKLASKEIVYSQLDLTSSEIEVFDKVFDSYFEKRSAIARERLPIMKAFAENASSMSDQDLKEFNAYLIKSNNKLNKLNKKYYNKARRVIPIKKATKLFLAEKFLRNEVELEILKTLFYFSM